MDITVTIFYILLVLAGLLVLGNVFTYPLQGLFIFRPRRLAKDYRFRFEAPFEEITLPVRHGHLNALWFRRPEGAPEGVVLYFHGNSANLVRWGNLYHYFFRKGYDFFVYDYRGFGKSRGRRSEGLLYEDAREVYRHVRQYYAPDRIVLFGRSLGTAFACRLAAEEPARLLILETPFAGMRDLFYTYYPLLPRLFLFKYRLANRPYLGKVACPVVIFQGTADRVVPYTSAVQLQPLLKEGDVFVTIPMGRHNDLMIYEAYQRKMDAILVRPPDGATSPVAPDSTAGDAAMN